MITVLNKAIHQLVKKPKILFLTDSSGALVTTLFLFVVLRNFNDYFGMPQTILTYLSLIPAVYFVYSLSCFLFLNRNWIPFIRAISVANLAYCFLTIGLLIIHRRNLTTMGIIYFLLEIIIICSLVYIELKVAMRIKQNKQTAPE